MRKKAIDNKYDKRHGHKNGAKQDKLEDWRSGPWLNKLRKKSQEEDG